MSGGPVKQPRSGARPSQPPGPGRPDPVAEAIREQSAAIKEQAAATREQTELLRQIASALFEIAAQGEEDEGSGPKNYVDGTPRR